MYRVGRKSLKSTTEQGVILREEVRKRFDIALVHFVFEKINFEDLTGIL